MILHLLLGYSIALMSPVHATSFYIRPFSEVTQSTPNIVHGTLHNIHTENSIAADGSRTIYTYANLEVKEVLKGDLHQKASVTLRKIGGTKDGMTLEVPSSPEFKEGDDTVLFLSAEKEDQTYEVLGLELGKFGLEEKNGEPVLTGGIFNYSKPAPGEEHEHTQRAKDLAENLEPWSLNKLRTLIQKQGNASAPTLTPNPSGTPLKSPPVASNADQSTSVSQTPVDSVPSEKTDEKPSQAPYYVGALILILGAFFFLRRK